MKKYIFGLDNTICITNGRDYKNALPVIDNINMINSLKEKGNHITIWTDREEVTGKIMGNFIYDQLKQWGVKYDSIILYKPIFDVLYDCKAHNMTISHIAYKDTIDENKSYL